jgi:hypothetical protein
MSDNIIYTNIPAIISSQTSLEAQIAMIDTILTGMLVAITTANLSGQFESYKLDTGQTKNEVTYRSITELQKAYEGMFKTKQMVISQLNINRQGRMLRLVDGRNFIGGNWNGSY